MRAFIAMCVMCAEIVHASVAAAEPRSSVCDDYNDAKSLEDQGNYESARASIERGLTTAQGECRIQLLRLKGAVLFKLREYEAALAAYQACLEAGATGARRREVQEAIGGLEPVKSTFIDITLANGPAAIYLDSETYDVFCRAAPTCHKAIFPGDYTVIAERPGFERWTGRITAVNGRTTALAITLVDSSSVLTVRVTPPGARVTVDDTPQGARTLIRPGVHRVAVSLAGYAGAEREITAHEGKPIELDVELAPLVPVRVAPPGAQLTLDGKPIAIDRGSIALPPGPHALVASERARGYRDQQIDIPALRPSDYRIAVELQPVELAAPAPGGSTHASSKVVPLAVGAGALALLGGGLGFELRAESRYAAAKSEMMSQQRRDSLYDSANAHRHVADAFAVGGLATGAAALWLYLRDRNGERGATTSASVRVVPMMGGLALSGQFR